MSTNNLRENLSELDKIFIPEDLDNNVSLEDLMSYKQGVKCWRTVPKNYSLVKQNIFTQEISNINGHGIKFMIPVVHKTILVSRHAGMKKYTSVEAFSQDGISLKIDFSVMMKINDPAKYISGGKNQNKQLDAIISRLLLGYISDFGFEHVVTGECAINRFDQTNELNNFANQYGISIDKVLIEKVTLPENLRKLYNDTAEERQKRNAQAIRLQAEKEKAESDATISRVNAQAEAERIQIIEAAKTETLTKRLAEVAASLKKDGHSDEQIAQAIRTYIMSETGNVIYVGDNLDAKNIAAGISGSQQVQPTTVPVKARRP